MESTSIRSNRLQILLCLVSRCQALAVPLLIPNPIAFLICFHRLGNGSDRPAQKTLPPILLYKNNQNEDHSII